MKTKEVLRFMRFTALWCFALPLFFKAGNRGTKYRSLMVRERRFKLVKKLANQRKYLLAWEMLWSGWNPAITEETTKPLYRFCGGNRHPFLATMAVFVYSGLFLHGFWMGITWVWILAIAIGHYDLIAHNYTPWLLTLLYSVLGLPIAIVKWWRAVTT